MAYSMWVLLQNDRLPDVEAFLESVRASEFPLTFDTDWDWASHIGWLPMHWDGEESGCEIEFEILEKDDIDAAVAAGFSALNSAVVLTTSGWDSLKVASAIAACLAAHCDAVVSEDADEYLASDDVLDWARRGIKAAEQGERDEAEQVRERAKASETLPTHEDADTQLFSTLYEFAGSPVSKFMLLGDGLAINLEEGYGIQGRCWRFRHEGRVYDVTRYRREKKRETDLLMSADDDDDWASQADAMQSDIEAARKLDNADMEGAFEILKSWAGQVSILHAVWASANIIEVTLSSTEEAIIEYSTGSYLASITVRTPDMSIEMHNDEIRVVNRS